MNLKLALTSSLSLLCLAACGDDGDGGNKTSYVPENATAKSDGTQGGDVAALQYRLSELQCGCESEDVQKLCVDFVWGDDGVMCVRDAINKNAAQNKPAIDCAEKTLKTAIDCYEKAGCDEAKNQACMEAYEKDADACPDGEQSLMDETSQCILNDDSDDGSSSSDGWDDDNSSGDDWLFECSKGEKVDPDYVCDGEKDCDDGSDEKGC